MQRELGRLPSSHRSIGRLAGSVRCSYDSSPMPNPTDRFAFSRSARDLIGLAAAHPELHRVAQATRPALAAVALGIDKLEEALDRERRELVRTNEARLQRYLTACATWESPGRRNLVHADPPVPQPALGEQPRASVGHRPHDGVKAMDRDAFAEASEPRC